MIAVAGGAGGHAGTQSPFSLVREIREFWDGVLVLGGAMSDGASARAAEIMGADFAYMGTRFIATQESMAQPEYKQMVVDSGVRDIVHTDAISAPTPTSWAQPQEGRLRSRSTVGQRGQGQDPRHRRRSQGLA